MFSLKELNKTSRTFGYIEKVSSGKAKELLYFSTKVRGEPEIQDSDEDLAKYQDKNGVLLPAYQYKILPCSEFKEGFERDTVYCCGGPGSGKTYQIGQYIVNYHKLYPDNGIFYVSANNINNDASLEAAVSLTRVSEKDGELVEEKVLKQINLLTIGSAFDHQQWKNCLIIFDDIIDINPTVDVNEVIDQLTEDERKKFQKGMTLKEREALENYAMKKMKRCTKYIKDSIENILKGGRKQQISIIIVDHKLNSGPATYNMISQCSSFWLFPYANNSKNSLERWLRDKISFDKDEATTIAGVEFFQFDFLFLNKAGKKFAMTPDRLITF